MSTRPTPGAHHYTVRYVGQDGIERVAGVRADSAADARSAVTYWRRNRGGKAVARIVSARRLPVSTPVHLPHFAALTSKYL